MRRCPACGKAVSGWARKVYCNRVCKQAGYDARQRGGPPTRAVGVNRWTRAAARRQAARLQRPRCVVCSEPIHYGQPGTNIRSRTCSTKCSGIAWKWFGKAA